MSAAGGARPPSPARLVLGLLVLHGACDGGPEARARARDAAVPVEAAAAALSIAPPVARAPVPLLRVIAREGDVRGATIDDAPARDALVHLGADGVLQLALADHARLSIRGPATVLLAPAGAPALLLREGVLTVDCAAPLLPTEAPALWVATPSARLEVAQRARFVLQAGPRASVLSLASGAVRVRQSAAVHDLADDATTCMSARARWAHQPLRGKLEARSEAIRKLPPCARVVSEPSDALLGDELQKALVSLDAANQRARALLASHRALSTSDVRGAAAQQRAISLHAAEAMRLTDEVRARRSVLAARSLDTRSAPLRALLDRAARAAP